MRIDGKILLTMVLTAGAFYILAKTKVGNDLLSVQTDYFR